MNSFYSKDELAQLGLAEVGDHVLISRNACFYNSHKIRIGHHVRIDDFCILSGNITLENYIHIAAYSCLYGGNAGIRIRDFGNLSSRVSIYAISDDYSGATMTNPIIPDTYKNVTEQPVLLEKHVIIGSTSVVLPGSHLEEGASFGSLSLIKGTYPSFGIYVGTPATFLRPREKGLLYLEQKFLEEFH